MKAFGVWLERSDGFGAHCDVRKSASVEAVEEALKLCGFNDVDDCGWRGTVGGMTTWGWASVNLRLIIISVFPKAATVLVLL